MIEKEEENPKYNEIKKPNLDKRNPIEIQRNMKHKDKGGKETDVIIIHSFFQLSIHTYIHTWIPIRKSK